ncbi:MAG TPA: glycoside hydrolase family 15 protein, partial [Gaiellaceae bacterium]|nr:glycoside hydrolase family 15 protein [Gaiellaceae bacterium]
VDGYAPIEDYALIADGRTCALVARDGSVDWLAVPRLDSETVFARLLDSKLGGTFELAPDTDFRVEREYVGDSNVLRTTFVTARGTARVTDAITLDNGNFLPWFELVRGIEGVTGMVPMRWRIAPRFGAGERPRELTIERLGEAVLAVSRPAILAVYPFDAGEPYHTDDEITGSFELGAGERALLVLRATHHEPIPVARRDWAERRLHDTASDWDRWLADAGVEGEWNAEVRRSALALRALTYVPTGAIVAAPTTSLPERIGGERNYDYRYAWVRDTAFTLDALINLGLLVQVHASFAWLLRAIERTEPDLHVFYDLDGDMTSNDEELELDGYRGSGPVRRGNAAASQLQLGCYGDLFETAELYVREGNALDEHTAARLADILDHLMTIWRREDSGIWELPELEQYTISKIAVWAAFDRALRLVERGQLPRERAKGWREAAKEVREFVERECWSEPRGCYMMFPGSARLDASILRVSRMGFIDVTGERFSTIIDAIRSELDAGDGLLYRYSGQQRVEGAFVACSFWLVEALARAGRVDEARRTMRQAIGHANDVGLFSEEIDPETGAFLGNFPQGLSHLALVNAAAAIRDAS